MSFDWDDLRIFLAVCAEGSHAGAARALGVDATTVGRRLLALEQSSGAQLFERTATGLQPSDAGRLLRPRAERVASEIQHAERELQGADARVTGPIRVTAGDGLVSYVLTSALAPLLRQHPGLVVTLRADTRTLDLSRREADVAVRLGRPSEPDLVARKLASMRFAVYASASYLARRGAPSTLKQLAAHDLIGFDASLDHAPQVAWLHQAVPGLAYALRANTTVAQVTACAAGLGVALLPTFVSSHEPRLVRILPRAAPPTRELYAVTHADLRRHARVKLIIAWLVEQLVGEL